MSIASNQYKNASLVMHSAYIRIVSQIKNDRPYCYAILNWNRGKVSKSLGNYPYLSATPLLDIVILAALRPDFLTDEELQRLLYADKCYRPFAFQWAHYLAFLNSLYIQPAKRVVVPSPPKAMPRSQVALPQTPLQTRKFQGLLKVGELYARPQVSTVKSSANKVPAKVVLPAKKPSLLIRFWHWIGW